MIIDGDAQYIKTSFNDYIDQSRPIMLSKDYISDFPTEFYPYGEEDKKDGFNVLVGVFFTNKPVYIFGVINLDKNMGSLRQYNEYSFETFLFEIVSIVLKNFSDSTFRHQRAIIMQIGKELSEHLKLFNGEYQFVAEGVSEDIYAALTDVDTIEDYIEFQNNNF